MLWILMAVLVLIGAVAVMRKRKSYESREREEEPWRASLGEEDGTLDMEAIREAEDEWLREEPWTDSDDEEWR